MRAHEQRHAPQHLGTLFVTPSEETYYSVKRDLPQHLGTLFVTPSQPVPSCLSSPSLYYSLVCLSLLPLLVALPFPLPPQANSKRGSMTMAESAADYEDEEGSAGGSESGGGGGRMDNTYGSIDLMDDTLPSIGGMTKKSGKSVKFDR